jgi:hypothetical protein
MTEYEVLYYKRTNKVHKSKGVSKADGFLSVDGRSLVLRGEDNKVVYSGTSKEFEDVQEDAVVVCGGYLVEVLSSAAPPPAKKQSVAPQRAGGLLSQGDKKKSALVSKRTPLQKTPKVTNDTEPQSCENMASTSAVKKPALVRKMLPLQRKTLKTQANAQEPARKTLLPQKRALPGKLATSQVKSQICTGSGPKTSLSKRRPLQSKARAPLVSSSRTAPAQSQAASPLPHIPLPATICKVLRPHQVTGVDFLWKSLATGGTILADEMGLGKSLMKTLQCLSLCLYTCRQC